MSEITEHTDGTVEIRLADDEEAQIESIVKERLAIPVFAVVETGRWTTDEGYEIVEYEHRRVYPDHLKFPRIVPGQTEEKRGYPCLACGSTDTSLWTVSNLMDLGSFECHNCGALGQWFLGCQRRPIAVHLEGECDCAPDCGCRYDPEWGHVMPDYEGETSTPVHMTVPITHKPGCTNNRQS
jgi:hypothetical protein